MLRQNKFSPPKWFLIVVVVIVFAAILRDFIAGDKPILAYSQEKGIELPVFSLENRALENNQYEWSIMPLIPYDPEDVTTAESIFLKPLSTSDIDNSIRYTHWLGTDRVGRDVLAGIVYGCRIALIIGIVSSLISLLIGFLLGALAGYFGNRHLKMNWPAMIAIALLTIYYIYYLYWQSMIGTSLTITSLLFYIIFTSVLIFLGLRYKKLQMSVPLDFLIMRGVDFLSSIPALLVLLVLSVSLRGWNVYEIAIVIGIFRWPTLCRHVRAEVMALRNSEEVEYSKGLGFSDIFILTKQLFWRSIQPALVVISFVTASSIVLEATLSFLGLGLPAETISWGNLIHQSRANPEAWWLIVFPGIMLFLIVYGLNSWGKKLNKEVHQSIR